MGAYHGKGCPGLPPNTSIQDLINRQNLAEIADSLTLCYFIAYAKTQSIGFAPQRTAEGELFQPEYFSDLILASTGRQIDLKELIEIGERIFTMKRIFITKLGINRKDDRLPTRFTESPRVLDDGTEYRAEVEPMLPEYYKLRGWNEQGIPTEERLKELKIEPI